MAILTVGTGTGYEYSSLNAAVAAAQNGDIIQVAAGTYDTNNLPPITTKITIQGIGGVADFVTTTPSVRAVIQAQADITLDHVELSGATDLAGNGAGILDQGGNLSINASEFDHNQEGVLVGSDIAPIGTVNIVNSNFGFNGVTSGPTAGYTHNLYISASTNGPVGQATIVGNYFHDEEGGGHELKVAANSTAIINNIIADGPNGTASYSIDLWNGGANVIEGNTIEKGANSLNDAFIHLSQYSGANAATVANTSLQISGNAFINNSSVPTPVLLLNSFSGVTPVISSNSVYSPNAVQAVNGAATVSNETTLTTQPAYSTANPVTAAADIDFTAPAGHDVAVAPGSSVNLFSGFALSVPDDGQVTLTLSGWKNGTVNYSGADAAITVSTAQAGKLTITGAASRVAADMTAGMFTYAPATAFSADAITASLSGADEFLDIGTGGAAAVESSIVVNAYATGSPTVLPDVSGSLSSAASTLLAQALAGLQPAGTALNVVTTPSGATTVAATAGALNALVASAVVAGSTVVPPAGYHAAYVIGGAPTTLSDTAGGSLLVATTAQDTLSGAANDTLIGGNSNDTLVAGAGAETLVSGTGANLIALNASTAFVASQGTDTITGSTAATAVEASGAPLYFVGSGPADFNAVAGAPTLVGGGAETVSAGASNMLLFGGTGALNFTGGSGVSTLVGGAAGATITGGSTGLLYFGTGPTFYNPGTAVDTVIGFTGTLTASGGASGTLFFTGTGGANNVSSGSGSSTIIGFGQNDTLTATGSGADVIAASGGAETVNGAGSTGANTFFAFGANDVLIGGSGQTALESGIGNHTLIAGSGSTLFEILASGANRALTIGNFNAGQDFVQLQGYAAGAGASALQTAAISGGSEILTLSDGSTLTFQGVTNLSASSFV